MIMFSMNSMRIILRAFVMITLAVGFTSCHFKNKEADVIFHNAKIYTVDGDFSVQEAIAIKDGKILAIGPEREILNEYNANKVIDCQKRFIYPGFIDAHCHFLGYGQTLQEANLTESKSFDEVIEEVKAHRKKFPDKLWIIGRGWDQNDWQSDETMENSTSLFPDNNRLNNSFPDVPVMLTRIDGHAILVNQKALDIAGINTTTKVEGGSIEIRDGALTGILVDNAMNLIYSILPVVKDNDKKTALLSAQEACFKAGLTTVDDAGLMHEDVELIKQLHENGELKMRVYVMLSDKEKNYDHYLKMGIDTSDYLSVRAFKFYSDGALGSRGACLLNPYSDVVHRAEYGTMLKDKAYFEMRAQQLSEKGFQMCTHAIGDSANRVMLQVYANTLEGTNDKRWRIEHAQVVHKDDVEKFAMYSIIPSIQPTHATSDIPWSWERLGRNRLTRAYAYQELKQQLGMVALGTDFPVEEISPIKTFYAAVVRKDAKGNPTEGFQTENALTREEAMRGMTIWAAISNFEENKKGTLEAGKFADFVMLDQDLMQVQAEKILDTKVLMTVIGGEIVFGN